MTKKQLAGHKAALEGKLGELGYNTEGLKMGQCPDTGDESCFTQLRDLAAAHADLTCRCERQIKNALKRIEEGTYGTCVQCDETISEKRLKAVPWAALCKSCQEQEENNVLIVVVT